MAGRDYEKEAKLMDNPTEFMLDFLEDMFKAFKEGFTGQSQKKKDPQEQMQEMMKSMMQMFEGMQKMQMQQMQMQMQQMQQQMALQMQALQQAQQQAQQAQQQAQQAQQQAAAKKADPKVIQTRSPSMPALADGTKLNDEESQNLDLIMGVSLEIAVEIGRTRKRVQDILALSKGSLVVLDKLAGDQVDVYVNGKCIAHGDVVVIDDNFGIRISEIVQKPSLDNLT